jgi:formamidopyrimidine-DNA glycosylase
MEGARFVRVLLRRPDLRAPFPARFAVRLRGRTVRRLERRAKYLLAILSSDETLVMHLGMSGSFRAERARERNEDGPHDHVVFHMSSGFRITFTDPRRFGFMDLLTPRQLAEHPALSRLGPEPLSAAFDAAALARACRGKKTSLKAALLDQRVVATSTQAKRCISRGCRRCARRRRSRRRRERRGRLPCALPPRSNRCWRRP